MTYPQVVTRIATEDDITALLSLWDELREVGGRAERAVNPMASPDIKARLEEVIGDAMRRIVLVEVTGVPAGRAPAGRPLTVRSVPWIGSIVSGNVGVPATEKPWTHAW